GDFERKLGRFQDAIRHYDESQKLPNADKQVAWDIAAAECEWGDSFGKPEEAIEKLAACQDRLEQLSKADDDQSRTRRLAKRLAASYRAVAKQFMASDKIADALKAYDRLQRITSLNPDVIDQTNLAELLDELGQKCTSQGKLKQARDAYTSAIALYEKQTPDSKRPTGEWQDRLVKLHE